MIHLSEAIVGIKNKPKAIGSGKKFKDLKAGDQIYIFVKNSKGTFEVKTITQKIVLSSSEWIIDPYDYNKRKTFNNNERIGVTSVNITNDKELSSVFLPKDCSFALRIEDSEITFLYTTSKDDYEYTLNKFGIEIPK